MRDRYGLGIILHCVSKEMPFLVLIALAVLRTQGATYDLVAENLGASPWQRLRYVSLPLVLPALAAGAALVFAFVFGAYEVPALLGLNVLFLRLGLAGSVAGVVLMHLVPVLPYAIFAPLGVFARYDEGYELQARTLGAGPTHVWLRVALPLLGPGLAAAALFAFLVSWSQYVLTLLIGGGRVMTLPILLFAAVSGGNPTLIAGLALRFAAPPVIAIALAARALSAGAAEVGQQY